MQVAAGRGSWMAARRHANRTNRPAPPCPAPHTFGALAVHLEILLIHGCSDGGAALRVGRVGRAHCTSPPERKQADADDRLQRLPFCLISNNR